MNELSAIEKINEEIKSIVSVAENISLTATEAMREATQAGINAVGFTLIARELRVFSEKTADGMESLSWLIEWQVAVNAGKRYREESRGILVQAYADPSSADVQTDEAEQLIVSQVCDLQVGMMRTAKQCTTGLLIARSVDMQTSPGGTMTLELHRIMQEMEEVIGNVSLRVSNLESQLTEAGLWKRQRLFSNPVKTDEYPVSDRTAPC